MFNISSFLDRFRNILLSDVALKETVANCLSEVLKVKIEKDSVSVKNGTISVKCSPIIKGEIFMKKAPILAKIKESLAGQEKIWEVR